MDLIDTHIHLLHPELFTYAWCAEDPALQGRFGLEDYRTQMARAGGPTRVRGMVFIEADVPGKQQAAEMEYFARLADMDRGEPPLIALIAGAAPESADFPRRLAVIGGEGRVRGLRRVFHTQPDGGLQSARLAENLRLLPRTGLTFDLCVRPRQLAWITDLVTACPETQFVLDHCGAPDVANGDLRGWCDGIRRLARRPNVACKFSGLGSLADSTKPLTPQVQPVFDHCLECFSPERILYGSDWPVSANLKAWMVTTAELLAPLSEHERVAIGTGNVRRIYGLR